MTERPRARRPLALITGAGGGMGAACARLLSTRYRLVLCGRAPEPLAAVTDQLRRDGAEVAGTATGDLADRESIAAMLCMLRSYGPLDALVHTAAVSPSRGSWQTILQVNLASTIDLLNAVEPLLAPGAAGVVIASMAAHMFRSTPEVDAALDTYAPGDAVSALEPIVRAKALTIDPQELSNSAYYISKYAVVRLCERRAQQWGERGARLVSLSPGMVATSMGFLEAEKVPSAAGLADMAPVGRWGTPLDIAEAVAFLVSDAASFISGCDLKIDGGLIARLR